MSDTYERVKKVIIEKLDPKDTSVITMDADFRNDLNADSLDLVELIMGFEDEFGATIDDKEVENIKTVRQAVEFIDKQANA